MGVSRRTAAAAIATATLAISFGCSLAFPVDDRFKETSSVVAADGAADERADGGADGDGGTNVPEGGTDATSAADGPDAASIPPFYCDGAVLCRDFEGAGERADAGWTYSFIGSGNGFDTVGEFFLSPTHSARAHANAGSQSAFVGQWLPTATKRTQLRLAFSFRANQLTEVRPFTMILSADPNQVVAPYVQIWPLLKPISGKLVLDVNEKALDKPSGGTIQENPHPITDRLIDVGEWIALEVWATGTEIVVFMNGAQVLRENVAVPWVAGYPLVEFGAIYYDDADLNIDDVRAFLP